MIENPQQRLRLVTILGSTREGRFGPTIARWFDGIVKRREEWELDPIDVAELGLPPTLVAEPNAAVRSMCERLKRADAFVVVVPEYNHGYPASLKHAIDFANTEWWGKPVGFVSYGGQSGGIRAAEQLRQVFAELRAVSVRASVALRNPWLDFESSDAEVRDRAAARMLTELAWWATALRRARIDDPSVGAATPAPEPAPAADG